MLDAINWSTPPPEGWYEQSIRVLVLHALRGADCITLIDLAVECWNADFFLNRPLKEVFALVCLCKALDRALASGLSLIEAAEETLQSPAWKDLCELYGFDHRRVVDASAKAIEYK